MPPSCTLFPATNSEGNRPDFAIHREDGERIGYVEVECASNDEQISRFRRTYEKCGIRVFYITGYDHPTANLTLEAIAGWIRNYLKGDVHPQIRLSCLYVEKLIAVSIDRQADNSRKPVSEGMLTGNALVNQLTRHLINAGLVSETGKAVPGSCSWDTVKEQGFSLKVYSRVSSSKQLALLSISGGRPEVVFASAVKYRKYLSDRPSAVVEEWIRFLSVELKAPIGSLGENNRCSVPDTRVLSRMAYLVALVGRLVSV